MGLLKTPRSEMIPEKLQKREEEKVNSRPLSMLTQLVKNNTQVLENAKERWVEVSNGGKGKKSKPVDKDRCISKMFLCWVLVVL
ncbi:hypothetical protein Celaphus_00016389 [Cervus elaphus hippelaphus]|uniref:Small nuclear ribonucleoprotein Sm D2 n=1 Tax=Cervus elaphus hippelaphus TaxID=46360 RepID=A0A212CED9_CEREH|nr:hypothetical protein Celaphus_00016389 [Cervus elaphus hippelaphus]